MKGAVNLKTIIVLIILILVGVLGVIGVNTARVYMSGATAGNEPKGVSANPGDNGVKITWHSDKADLAYIEYGTTPASLLLRTKEETDPTSEHDITIESSSLKPNTNYFYRIRTGNDVATKNEWDLYDNNGIPFTFKSGGDSTPSPTAVPTRPIPTIGIGTTIVPTTKPASGSGAIDIPTTQPLSSGNCNRTTDYNHDGVINSIDYIQCLQGGNLSGATMPTTTNPTPTASTASGTVVSACNSTTDYDGNGVINSMDRIKCLQNQH